MAKVFYFKNKGDGDTEIAIAVDKIVAIRKGGLGGTYVLTVCGIEYDVETIETTHEEILRHWQGSLERGY